MNALDAIAERWRTLPGRSESQVLFVQEKQELPLTSAEVANFRCSTLFMHAERWVWER